MWRLKSMEVAGDGAACRDRALVSRLAVAEIATMAPTSREVRRVTDVVYDSTSARGVVELAQQLDRRFQRHPAWRNRS